MIPREITIRKPGRGAGVVLAGGRGRRFGSDKCTALVGGRPLLERVLQAHQEVFDHVVVVGRERPESIPPKVSFVPDERPGLGPLGGLQAGLLWATARGAEGVCCTPCDAPFLTSRLLRLLALRSGPADAVVPLSRGPLGYEPLFAWYSRRVLPALGERILHPPHSMRALIESLDAVVFVPMEEWCDAGDPNLLFFNINTPDDLELAERRFAEGGTHPS